MRITVSDIKMAEDFAKRLERVCDGILNGETRTEALGRESISLSVFLTLIKGLKKTSDDQDINDLRHSAWQDDLMADVTGDEYYYIPDDFEEALNDTIERVLDDEERDVIELLYPKRNTYTQTAEKTGLSENTVRSRRKSALKKLKVHVDEFAAGKKFLKNLDLARKQQDRYEQALDWMNEALEYLDDLGTDEDRKIEDQPVSPDALAFYRRNGLETLADVVEHSLPELFTKVSDAEGEYLAAVRSGDFSIDSYIDESMGLDTKIANAFSVAGIHTVREFLALPESEAFSIKGVGPKTVVYIYRRVLFG